jgi:acetolactate synthase-1/2/3 large subunit
MDEAVTLLGSARRPILLLGQGAAGAAGHVQQLAERIGSPVVTTASGRGVLPEDHALALAFDFNRGDVRVLNDMIRLSDCVVALGCKFSHPGTGGFQLELPSDRLIHVDASEEVLGANYPARLAILGSIEAVLDRLVPAVKRLSGLPVGGWSREEIEDWKKRLRHIQPTVVLEPIVHGVTPTTAGSFFTALRRILPRDGIVVTDSGLHQGLARRHFEVLAPRGLILPSDFQSMGFGLPAAIGAKLAAPERPVVAVLGDGGFAMSGMELLTAVREKIPLTVIVFNDGRLNLIRIQQFQSFGRSESTDILNPDFHAFASALGAQYALVDDNAEQVLRSAVGSAHVTLVEVLVGDSSAIHLARGKGLARETARKVLGPSIVRWLKHWRKRK